MTNPIRTEPALISGALVAVLNALVALSVISLTAEQISAVNVALVAVLTIFVRQSVTPTVKTGDAGDDEGPIEPADPPALG